MRIKLNRKKVVVGVLALCLTIPAIAFCESNSRQAGVQAAAGASNIDTLTVTSVNTIKGKIIADENSHVIIGDTNLSNVSADEVKIFTKNDTKKIIAKDNSTIAIGSTNISNLKAKKVDITSFNTITGKVKATDHSSVTVGNTNVQ